MVYRGGELSFFHVVHLTIATRTDISISLRVMITKFGKQVHQQELSQVEIIKQVLMKSSRQDHVGKLKALYFHYQSVYGKLGRMVTYQNELLPINLHKRLNTRSCKIA